VNTKTVEVCAAKGGAPAYPAMLKAGKTPVDISALCQAFRNLPLPQEEDMLA